jgi:predicted TIM-barrel fold metal-dependent hydrolase
MNKLKKYEVIDAHNHLSVNAKMELNRADAENLLQAADRLGIDTLCVSIPLTAPCPLPDEFIRVNNAVVEGMRMNRRFLGFCFVNPGYQAEALREVERCIVKEKMTGIKLYHQYLICDPAMKPLMTLAAELGVPVLMHAGKCTDTETLKSQPLLSNAMHFLKAAEMFPETTLIQGHIGGGGDWEWNLRVLEQCPPNVYIDTSGSVIDRGIVKKTIDALGIDHVLFATDGIFEEGVGKVIDAALSESEYQKLLRDNFQRILAMRKV